MPREVWDMRNRLRRRPSVRVGPVAHPGYRGGVRIPDETHPITIEPTGHRVVVRVGDTVVADSTAALTLDEANHAPVQYFPFADVNQDVLRRSDHGSYCPFKGDASYYDLVVDGREIPNAVWVYEDPYDAMAQIKGHVAFYTHNVSFESE